MNRTRIPAGILSFELIARRLSPALCFYLLGGGFTCDLYCDTTGGR